ncbi:uncharacterized protein LOC124361246 [Homalodisca vitripennis]|uniref:uncharacterized protein LOC124361246 n=1 Tax=Homalodisca vitripennis TaxID=197043 RepID=UPI001EE9BEE3|nr:uncharacterized protein LOC124361246 [Homalodisca vitripennis]
MNQHSTYHRKARTIPMDVDVEVEREIRKLLETEVIRPKLTPIPDISDILSRDVSKHPLMRFRVNMLKKHQVNVYLKERALTAKIDEFVKRMKKGGWDQKEFKKTLGIQMVQEAMKEYGGEAVVHYILPSWLKNIKQGLPKKLFIKYKDLAEKILEEVKKDYSKTMYDLGLYKMIKQYPDEVRRQIISPIKPDTGGKTANYPRYCAKRKMVQKHLFITHPLVRNIQKKSYYAFPEYFVDFSTYRDKDVFELDQLMSLINADLKKSEDYLSKTWYLKLMINFNRRILDGVPKKLQQHLIRCASNVIAIQVQQCVRRTVNHLLNVLHDPALFPQLIITAMICNHRVAIDPSFEDVFNNFCNVINNITRTCQELPSMETCFGLPGLNKFIPVKRSDSFTSSSLENLREILEEMFQPVNAHVDVLGSAHH